MPNKPRASFPFWILAVLVLAGVGWFGYTQFKPNLSSSSSNPSSVFAVSQAQVAAAFLNVRSQPSADAPKLQVAGSSVQVVRGEELLVSATRNDWYNVTVQGGTGFVNSKYVIPLQPEVSSDALKLLQDAAQQGTTLKLEAGVYRLPSGLNLAGGVQLEGQGWGETILVSDARGATLSSTGGKIGLKNLTIAHVGAAPAAAVIFRNNNLNLEGVRVMGGQDSTDPIGDEGDGLVLYDAEGEVKSSLFLGNVWRGLSIHGKSTVSVNSSKFTANSGSGVAITDTAQPILSRNEMLGNGLAGIKIFDQANPILQTNFISENTNGGIGFLDSATASLIDNHCANNGQYAVNLETKRKPNLAGNVGCVVAVPVVPKPQSPSIASTRFVENSATPGVSFAVPASRDEYLKLYATRNLWNMRLARNRGINFVTEATAQQHEARAKAAEVYAWGTRWCNVSRIEWSNELKKIDLRIEAGGLPIPTATVFQGAEPTSDGKQQFCYRISTLIRGQSGASIRLSVICNFLTGDVINTDQRPFEPGEHRIDLAVMFYQ